MHTWRAWFGFVLLCNAVGFASSLFGAARPAYAALVQPSFAPPSWVFAPVWTALYVLMGTATYLVWRATAGRRRRIAMTVFAVQLALNFAWTPVFFGLGLLYGGLLVIIANWLAVGVMTVAYAHARGLAGALVVPLWLWVSFATALNAGIWWLNP